MKSNECKDILKPIPPALDGVLLKLKHKSSIFGSWNKRYFRINKENETLEYFNDKSYVNKAPSFSMPLKSIKSIRKFDDCSFQIEGDKGVFLKAASIAEQTSWVDELNQYIHLLRVNFIIISIFILSS